LERRYVQLVYSTSWRVLKDEADARDVTQETFFELTRRAGRISGSLGCWLHRVATQKSTDLIRRRVHRRRREEVYARTRPAAVRSWQDLSGHVDQALERLDESTRSLLLDHFIVGETTSRIAQEQGISQATVSRRISAGLEQLRGVLRREGLLVATATLGTMLADNAAQAVSATVMGHLGKITTDGANRTAIVTSARKSLAAKVVLAVAGLVGIVTVAGYIRHVQKTSLPVAPLLTSTVTSGGAAGGGDQLRSSAVRRAAMSEEAAPIAVLEASDAEQIPSEESTLGPFGPTDPAGGPVGHGWQVRSAEGVVDLSTPAAAVYSLLSLLDEGDTSTLNLCLAKKDENVTDGPYPRYVGQPVRLVDIVEDDQTATVQWEATVHTPFRQAGRQWSPGEYAPFTSHVVLIDGLWKLAVFME
jgi:RNA polymerase sigma-70 factor (ECF subfamily)